MTQLLSLVVEHAAGKVPCFTDAQRHAVRAQEAARYYTDDIHYSAESDVYHSAAIC